MNSAYSTNLLINYSLSNEKFKHQFEKMWEPITNEQKTNMVSEMIKIKSEIQDKANDIKIEEKAK